VSGSAAIFDPAKLAWLSQAYMKAMPGDVLAERTRPYLAAAGLDSAVDAGTLARIVDTLRERASTLVELVALGRFYFERPSEYEAKAAQKFFTPEGRERLGLLIERLGAAPDFAPATVESIYRELTTALGVKLVDLAQLTRLAITGRTASPPLFEVVSILGRDETLARLGAARVAAEAAA
jgi:glutamyl-tRNA synthetase